MSSQLASQLRVLAKRAANDPSATTAASSSSKASAALKAKRSRYGSFMFDREDASRMSREMVYDLGWNGICELVRMNSVFEPFKETLFSNKIPDRMAATPDVNKQLDRSIDTFLRLLTPYFTTQCKACHKVLEYLIRRHEIHEHNIESVLACVLPAYNTPLFARILQLIRLDHNTTALRRWLFLVSAQQERAPLTRQALARACLADVSLLEFLAQMVRPVCLKDHPLYPLMVVSACEAQTRVLLAFYTTIVLEVIAMSPQGVTDTLLRAVLPVVLDFLRNPETGAAHSAAYMIVCQLYSRAETGTPIADMVTDSLVQQVAKRIGDTQHATAQTVQRALTTMCVLCRWSNRDQAFSARVLNHLEQSAPLVIDAMGHHVHTHAGYDTLVWKLCRALIGHGRVPMLEAVMESDIRLDDKVVDWLVACLLASYIDSCPAVLSATSVEVLTTPVPLKRANVARLLSHLGRRYYSRVDAVTRAVVKALYATNTSGGGEGGRDVAQAQLKQLMEVTSRAFVGTAHELVPESGTSLFLSLNHPEAHIRVHAVELLDKLWHDAQTADKGQKPLGLSDADVGEMIIQRIMDDEPTVVAAALTLPSLTRVVTAERVVDVLVDRLQHVKRAHTPATIATDAAILIPLVKTLDTQLDAHAVRILPHMLDCLQARPHSELAMRFSSLLYTTGTYPLFSRVHKAVTQDTTTLSADAFNQRVFNALVPEVHTAKHACLTLATRVPGTNASPLEVWTQWYCIRLCVHSSTIDDDGSIETAFTCFMQAMRHWHTYHDAAKYWHPRYATAAAAASSSTSSLHSSPLYMEMAEIITHIQKVMMAALQAAWANNDRKELVYATLVHYMYVFLVSQICEADNTTTSVCCFQQQLANLFKSLIGAKDAQWFLAPYLTIVPTSTTKTAATTTTTSTYSFPMDVDRWTPLRSLDVTLPAWYGVWLNAARCDHIVAMSYRIMHSTMQPLINASDVTAQFDFSTLVPSLLVGIGHPNAAVRREAYVCAQKVLGCMSRQADHSARTTSTTTTTKQTANACVGILRTIVGLAAEIQTDADAFRKLWISGQRDEYDALVTLLAKLPCSDVTSIESLTTATPVHSSVYHRLIAADNRTALLPMTMAAKTRVLQMLPVHNDVLTCPSFVQLIDTHILSMFVKQPSSSSSSSSLSPEDNYKTQPRHHLFVDMMKVCASALVYQALSTPSDANAHRVLCGMMDLHFGEKGGLNFARVLARMCMDAMSAYYTTPAYAEVMSKEEGVLMQLFCVLCNAVSVDHREEEKQRAAKKSTTNNQQFVDMVIEGKESITNTVSAAAARVLGVAPFDVSLINAVVTSEDSHADVWLAMKCMPLEQLPTRTLLFNPLLDELRALLPQRDFKGIEFEIQSVLEILRRVVTGLSLEALQTLSRGTIDRHAVDALVECIGFRTNTSTAATPAAGAAASAVADSDRDTVTPARTRNLALSLLAVLAPVFTRSVLEFVVPVLTNTLSQEVQSDDVYLVALVQQLLHCVITSCVQSKVTTVSSLIVSFVNTVDDIHVRHRLNIFSTIVRAFGPSHLHTIIALLVLRHITRERQQQQQQQQQRNNVAADVLVLPNRGLTESKAAFSLPLLAQNKKQPVDYLLMCQQLFEMCHVGEQINATTALITTTTAVLAGDEDDAVDPMLLSALNDNNDDDDDDGRVRLMWVSECVRVAQDRLDALRDVLSTSDTHYQRLFEAVFAQVKLANAQQHKHGHGDDHDGGATRGIFMRRFFQLLGEQCMSLVHSLSMKLSAVGFCNTVRILLAHEQASVRLRTLALLVDRLQHVNDSGAGDDDDADGAREEYLRLVTPLVDVLTITTNTILSKQAKVGATSDTTATTTTTAGSRKRRKQVQQKQEESPNDALLVKSVMEEMTTSEVNECQENMLLALDQLVQLYGDAESAPLLLDKIPQLLLTHIQSTPKAPAAIYCFATMCEKVGTQLIPHLPAIMTTVIERVEAPLAAAAAAAAVKTNVVHDDSDSNDDEDEDVEMESSEEKKTMKRAREHLNGDDGDEAAEEADTQTSSSTVDVYMSSLSFFQVAIESLSSMLTPYLARIIRVLIHPALVNTTHHDRDTLRAQVDTIYTVLCSHVEIRLLLPAIFQCFKSALALDYSTVSRLYAFLARTCEQMSPQTVLQHDGDVFKFVLVGMDIRQSHWLQQPPLVAFKSSTTLTDAESSVCEVMEQLVLKMNEKRMKLILVKLLQWAGITSATIDNGTTNATLGMAALSRCIPVLTLMERLLQRFQSIFVPHFELAIDLCVKCLEMKQQQQSSSSSSSSLAAPIARHMHVQLVQVVVGSLTACFKHDEDGFFGQETFDRVALPLVSHCARAYTYCHNDDHYTMFVSRTIAPCIVQLADRMDDFTLWKPFNHEALLLTRDPNPLIKCAAIDIIHQLFQGLKERWLVMLPETVPFIAELLEDTEVSVEMKVQELVRVIEDLSGESLNEYLE